MMFFKKRVFTREQEQQLLEAIRKAELQTSGEIRVHVDSAHVTEPLERAKEMFTKLKMHKTELRNGILFYINFKERKFAVWGDEGINKNVPENFWDNIKETAVNHFKNDEVIEGLGKCIEMCGEQLKHYFPVSSSDKNELKNDISY
jgi:uncharacterized membrane protein